MSLTALYDLLQSLFSRMNAANRVPNPTIYNAYRAELEELAASEMQDELISLGRGILLPRSFETARILQNLRQRFEPDGRARPLVGRIRAEAVLRQRPRWDRDRSSLSPEATDVAALFPRIDKFSSFQVEGWQRVLDTISHRESLIIVAPTGSGKTEVFLLPTIYSIAQRLKARSKLRSKEAPHFVLLYPRVALLKDQLSRIFRYVFEAEKEYLRPSTLFGHLGQMEKGQGIVIGFQFNGVFSDASDTRDNRDIFDEDGTFLLIDQCPICNTGHLRIPSGRSQGGITLLKCTSCPADFRTTISKKDHAKAQPHILVTTAESLDRIYLNPIPEFEEYLKRITGIIIDEVHMYYSLYGVHIYNLIRRIEALKEGESFAKIAASATVSNPESFAAKLFYGRADRTVPVHRADLYTQDPAGLEVIYFLQSPEESNRPGAAPTLIQSTMALNHATLKGTDRSLIFTESLDMAGRLETQIRDAETVRWNDLTRRRGLWEFRTNLNVLSFDSRSCPHTTPAECSAIYLQGECWRGILGEQNCTRPIEGLRERSLNIVQVSSQQQNQFWIGDVVVATSALEVGVDDERIKSTIHYLPPRTVFSFIQRRGRAGRRTGEISYTLMILGNTPSDHFYFFRRNRLINGRYELPLNPQNPVLRKMHDRLQLERERLRSSIEQARGSQRGTWNWIWETITHCDLLDRHYRDKFDAYRGRSMEDQRRFVREWIITEKGVLESYLNLRWLLRTIEDESPDKLRETAKKAINAVDLFLTEQRNEVEEIGQLFQELDAGLIQILYNKETDSETRGRLRPIRDNILKVWDAITQLTWKINPRSVECLYDFFRILGDLYPKAQKKQGRVLNSPPDALKTVLQAMFYLHLGNDENDETNCPSQIDYYIPSAYFQAVKPIIVEVRRQRETKETDEPDLHQEDVTNAATLLIPYKPIYRYHPAPFLSIVDTEHDPDLVSSDGREVTIRLRAEGLRRSGALIPQKIYVKPLKGDDQGQQIVKICPQCYALYSANRQRRCHDSLYPVKLYAEPIVERNYTSSQPARRITRTLRFLADLQGTTTMKGSEVRAVRAIEGDNEYTITRTIFREFQALYDLPVRYSLSTNGIAWDLKEVVKDVLNDTDIRQKVEQVVINGNHKEFNEELILHTAAHMLHKTIASISGVNEQLLEYWYDISHQEVVIWERYEGGAGISEVFENVLRTSPVNVYQELLVSAVCLVDLAERKDWQSPEALEIELAERWKLPLTNEVLRELVQEADKERQAQAQQQGEEMRLICRPPQGSDGCPACVHTTYCTKRNDQALTVSRLAGEAILRYLIKRVKREEVEMLIGEANLQGVIPPITLTTDPIQEAYDVLLL